MCVPWFFGHRCWQYHPDLSVIFPLEETCHGIDGYLFNFPGAVSRAPTIADFYVTSILYCRTNGPNAHPFLLVYLRHLFLSDWPVRLKLNGFDGPPTVQDPHDHPRYDTAEERATFTVAYARQTQRQLAGTRRYTVCHTMAFGAAGPDIVDLLAVAQVSYERDHTRAGYPAALFLAVQHLFNGVVTNSAKHDGHILNAGAEDASRAVIEKFPARREYIQQDIDLSQFSRWMARQVGFLIVVGKYRVLSYLDLAGSTAELRPRSGVLLLLTTKYDRLSDSLSCDHIRMNIIETKLRGWRGCDCRTPLRGLMLKRKATQGNTINDSRNYQGHMVAKSFLPSELYTPWENPDLNCNSRG
jgi:hypothetical protein